MTELKFSPKQRQILESQGKHPLVIETLESTMNRHQLSSELIMEMSCEGWLAYEIIKFCEVCDEKQLPIDSAWRLHQRLAKDGHPLFSTN